MGSQGAACFHTLTTAEQDIPKVIWDVQRVGDICTTADTFANWKTVIEELCSESKDCDVQTQQKIEAFFGRINDFSVKRAAILKDGLTHH